MMLIAGKGSNPFTSALLYIVYFQALHNPAHRSIVLRGHA